MRHEDMERCSTEDRREERFVDHCIDEAVLVGIGELGLSAHSVDGVRREG